MAVGTANKEQPKVLSLGAAEEKVDYRGQSLLRMALRRVRRDKLTLIALVILIAFGLLALLAPNINRDILKVNAVRSDISRQLLPPGTEGHILGTDDLGRDVLGRLLLAGQVSLSIAISAALLSITIGVAVGIFTGYYGGILDDFVTWLITTLGSIPTLLLLILISATLRPSPIVFILVLGLLGWLGTARLVRGETLSLRAREYVVGARAIGARPWRIMLVHILPNLVSVVVITLALDMGGLILTEAGLSFLGFGINPAASPSWGNMLNDAQDTLTPHLIILPGLLIWITVLCFYIIGDGLRDAFDPTVKEN